MKNIILAMMLFIAYTTTAQTLGYNDIGVLFTNQQINGTARYNAMSGAFGALGGDISSMDINPAGAAIFIFSEFGLSLSTNELMTTSSFYDGTSIHENNHGNLNQAGGVFVFNNYGANRNGWGKVAVGFNYSIANDFENFWSVSGNSNYPTWIEDPNDNTILYMNSDGQYFESTTTGRNNKYTFSVASQYNDNLYFGASLHTYDIDFYQQIFLEEYNYNQSNEVLEASLLQELITYGDGISFNFGLISIPSENVRFGLAYQSPVWYTLAEDYIDYDLEVYLSNTDELISDFSGTNFFDYKLRTPSKLTGSFGYIFDKFGLISVDYSYKNYSNIQLSGANFSDENQQFSNDLESTGELRIGTEWRFNNLSIRGGYHTEKNPYKNSLDTDDLTGYSLGAGLKFRGLKIDASYQNSNQTAPYNFYPQYSEVNSAELDYDNSRYTLTLTLNI